MPCYAMLCYAMLCHAVLCHAMLCHAMPCHAISCYAMHAVLRHAMLCYAMLCYAMPSYAMPCHAMLCYATQCYAILRNALQGMEGQYTLRYKMQDEVNAIAALGQLLIADVNVIYSLVTYQGVHPLYLDVKELVCCKAVDFIGNLWLSMFCACCFSVVLVVAMMCYIHRLDKLPKKRSALFASLNNNG